MKKGFVIAAIMGAVMLGGCGRAQLSNEIVFTDSCPDGQRLCAIDTAGKQYVVTENDLRAPFYMGDDKYIGIDSGDVLLYDAASGEQTKVCDEHNSYSGAHTFVTRDGKYVYFGDEEEKFKYFIKRYSFEDGSVETVVDDLSYSALSSDLYVSPDNKRVYYVDNGERTGDYTKSYGITCYDTDGGKSLIAKSAVNFDVSSDESFMVYTKANDAMTSFYRLDLNSGEEEKLFTIKQKVSDLDINDNDGGSICYVTYRIGWFNTPVGHKIWVYDLNSGKKDMLYKVGSNQVLTGICWGK